VPLDVTSAQRHRRPGGRETGLVPRIPDRALREPPRQGVQHAQVEIARRARIARRRVSQQQILAAGDGDRFVDLLQGGHAGRQDQRPAGGPHGAQQVVIGERRRGRLGARRIEALHELDRFVVPAGGEPEDAALAAVAVDGRVFAHAEFHLPPVVDVGHPPPRGLPFQVPLLRRHAALRGPFLELDRVGARQVGAVDQLSGQLHRAVVIDADLRDDEARLPRSHPALSDLNRRSFHWLVSRKAS